MELDIANIKLIVGLGNPGPKFSNTRHNVGAEAVAKLSGDRKTFIPDTFMNECGPAIAKFAQKNGLAPEEILVIHDDIDLRPGEMKFKDGGSAGGHNGLRSLIAATGSDAFKRIRIGVGRPFPHKPTTPAEEEAISRYVLSPIPAHEKELIDAAISRVVESFQ